MAKFVLKDVTFDAGATALSAYVESLSLNVESDVQENTGMGSNWKTRIGGLNDWSVDISLHQDFDASKVDATLWPLIGQSFTFKARPTSAVKSATNPEYNGTVILQSYSPIDGTVGDGAKAAINLVANGELFRTIA